MNKTSNKSSQAGSVRIIAGQWRRRRIAIPPGANLRPTPDRVRETLFNWLAPILPGATCLDLFAGTGALGFEALSRGAASCTMVENDALAVKALGTFAGTVQANVQVIRTDATDFLSQSPAAAYDIAFVDPPYRLPVENALSLLLPLMRPGGQVYLERDQISEWPQAAAYDWQRRSSAGMVEFGLALVDSA